MASTIALETQAISTIISIIAHLSGTGSERDHLLMTAFPGEEDSRYRKFATDKDFHAKDFTTRLVNVLLDSSKEFYRTHDKQLSLVVLLESICEENRESDFYESTLRPIINLIRAKDTAGLFIRTSSHTITWEKGSPYPGLAYFNEKTAPVFFGRSREIDDLVRMLNRAQHRFLAISGTSGSGKSSLVRAGLLPRIAQGDIPGIDHAHVAIFAPGASTSSPIESMVGALEKILPKLETITSDDKFELLEDLASTPDTLIDYCADFEVMLFIDQFEELFTRFRDAQIRPFINLLINATQSERFRVLMTLRADYSEDCITALGSQLVENLYPLAPPDEVSLYEMITKPADCSGLDFEGDLALRILHDTTSEPGALPLMAYALEKLYQLDVEANQENANLLTHATYDNLGKGLFDEAGHPLTGVRGAIGKQAEQAFASLPPDVQKAFPDVFRELVVISEEKGKATRKRALRSVFSQEALKLIEKLVQPKFRLLVSGNEGNRPTVEVAHEALFIAWPKLREWIDTTKNEMILRQQVEGAAKNWEAKNKTPDYLWPHERLEGVYRMIQSLDIESQIVRDPDPILRDFVRLECDWLLDEIDNPDTSHERREEIGNRLNKIGEQLIKVEIADMPEFLHIADRLWDPRIHGLRADGLPAIEWCPIPDGEVDSLKDRDGNPYHCVVRPFYISNYLITYSQYKAFLDSPDYKNMALWPKDARPERASIKDKQHRKIGNHPAENVTCYSAFAFCKWLMSSLSAEDLPAGADDWTIRLPTEWEWVFAATGNRNDYVYPWGEAWEDCRANTQESNHERTTAIGMYPQGNSLYGVTDMSGNVAEWCLNLHRTLEPDLELSSRNERPIRGGSWKLDKLKTTTVSRGRIEAHDVYSDVGFRIVYAPPPIQPQPTNNH